MGIATQRDLYEEIAKAAYDLYKKRGMKDGHDFDDWVKAEKVVIAENERLKRDEIDLMDKAVDEKVTKRTAKKYKKT